MTASRWTDWQPAIVGGVYAPIPAAASGIYAIRTKRSKAVRYVGMSWTGRLRKTCIRHFQRWKRDWQHQLERQVYDAAAMEIRWKIVEGGRLEVLRAESAAIAEMEPLDNVEVPGTMAAEEPADVAPF